MIYEIIFPPKQQQGQHNTIKNAPITPPPSNSTHTDHSPSSMSKRGQPSAPTSVLPPGISTKPKTKPKRPSGQSKNPRSANNNKDLRDPTVHELHNGPERSQLPETVRNNSRSETVCKFCGVSYLVFSEIKELEKRLRSAEDQLNDYRKKAKQFDTLQQKVHQLAAVQKQTQEDYSALQRRSSTLEACIFEREKALGRATKESETIKSKLSGVRSALQRERTNVSNLKMKTVRTLGDMSKLMKSTQHEISVVGTRLRREEDLRQTAEKELEIVKEMLQKERVLNEKNNDTISELKSNINTLEIQCKKEIDGLKKKNIESIQDLQNKHDSALNDLSTLQKELLTYQTKCTTLEKQILKEQELSEDRRNNIISLENELKNLKNNSNSTTAKLSKSLEELRRQHERLKMIHEMDKKKLVEEVHELSKILKEQQNNLVLKDRNIKNITNDKVQLNKENEALKNRLDTIMKQVNAMNDSLGNKSNESERNLNTIKELNDRINQLTNELIDEKSKNDTINTLNNKLKLELKNISNDYDDHKTKTNKIIDSQINEIGTLKTKYSSINGENKYIKNQLLLLEEKNTKTMDALVEANLEKERCQVKIKELKTTNESIQKDVTTKEDIILKLRHELAMKNEENNQLKAAAAAAAASDDGDSKVNQETVDGIEMLEKHLIKLSEKLRNKNNEVEQLQGVIHRECIQRGILMDELEELRTK